MFEIELLRSCCLILILKILINSNTSHDEYDQISLFILSTLLSRFCGLMRENQRNFVIANALSLLKLVKSDDISPGEFLRYLEDGGHKDIHLIMCVHN